MEIIQIQFRVSQHGPKFALECGGVIGVLEYDQKFCSTIKSIRHITVYKRYSPKNISKDSCRSLICRLFLFSGATHIKRLPQ